MSAPSNWNKLDYALAAFLRSRSAMPELLRQLAAAETLYSLVPYHPEVVDGEMSIQNGSPFPFIRLQGEEGDTVPIFSCLDRVEESLERAGVPANTFVSAALPGRQMLEVIGVMNFHAELNKSCHPGSFIMPPAMMRDLACGEVFQPKAETGLSEERTLKFIDPADYPTDLVQPLFELMRRHKNFRAAWIFGLPEPPLTADLTRYQLMVLMDPRDEHIFHELNIVAQNACYKTVEVHLGRLREDDPAYMESFVDLAPPPFYAAPDFVAKPVI